MKKTIVLITVLFAALFFARVSLAATYYVATTGNDANPGTISQPFRTIQKAADVVHAGDTILVRSGTYQDNVQMQYSGTSGNPITLKNYPGEHPVLDFGLSDENGPVRRLTLVAAEGYVHPIGWIVIEGLEVTRGYDGIKFYNAHDVIIRRNYIHNNAVQGILGNGIRVTIDGNIVSRNGLPILQQNPGDNKNHGMYLSGTDFTITNNLVYSNAAYGIQVAGYPYDPARHASSEYAGAQNFLISNNIIAFNWNRAGIVIWLPDAINTAIQNNVLYENSVNYLEGIQGINFNQAGGGNIVRNNLFYSSSGKTAIYDSAGGSSYTQTNSINADPLFANAQGLDFHLKPGSPAIDKGFSAGAPSTDYAGVSRPQGVAYDIGAYEYVSGATLTGDVNQDSKVDVLDVQACVNHILAVQDYGSSADVNKDGSVNVLDVQTVVNIILGV